MRIVLDPNQKLNKNTNLLKDKGAVLIYNKKKMRKNLTIKIFIKNKSFKLEDILKDILEKGIGSIIVEGGAKTLNNFIKEGMWDEARIFNSNKKFKKE